MDIFDEKYISPLVCDLEDCEEICPHFYWDEKHIGSCKLDDNWQKIKPSVAIPSVDEPLDDLKAIYIGMDGKAVQVYPNKGELIWKS